MEVGRYLGVVLFMILGSLLLLAPGCSDEAVLPMSMLKHEWRNLLTYSLPFFIRSRRVCTMLYQPLGRFHILDSKQWCLSLVIGQINVAANR